jgi:hypothetical protein
MKKRKSSKRSKSSRSRKQKPVKKRFRFTNALIGVMIVVAALFAWKMLGKKPKPDSSTPAAVTGATPTTAPAPDDKQKAPTGRWRKFRGEVNRDQLSDEEKKALAKLQTIGYASGSRPPKTLEIINVYKPDKAYPGLNLFTSGHFPGAYLMDMKGNLLHTWQRTSDRIWPTLDLNLLGASSEFWRTVHLFENGDVLGIFDGIGIFKLDAHSNLIWSNQNGAHHNLGVQPNGDIYLLARTAHVIPRLNEKEPILEDYIVIMDADGNEKKRVSMIECFENSDAYPPGQIKWEGDVFHANKVHVLDDRFAGRFSWYKPGYVLTSLRNISTIAVVDMDRRLVVKAWYGEQEGFKAQHHPVILDSGNMLFFDNLGGGENRSRVLEVDPATFETVWRYDGTENDPLFSPTMSTAEYLPNGNILITESDNGRALEVTRDKEIVWEFYNPYRVGRFLSGEKSPVQYIATLTQVMRLPIDFPVDWTVKPRQK